jgi:putative nucleotidyltransferase with HDIG domain
MGKAHAVEALGLAAELRQAGMGLASAHLQAVLEVSRALMREHNLADLLRLIAEGTSQVMAAERSSIYLVDPDRNELYTFVAQGLEIREIRVPIGTGLSGHVAQTGETLNIADAYQDPRFDKGWDLRTGFRTRTVLCTPLLAQTGEIIGVLQVLNKKDDRFTAYDAQLLSAFASQAATAVENAQLHEANRKQFESFIETLAATIDAKSPFTAGHSKRVALYASRLARAVGLSEELVEKAHFAGLLHDIGKISIPDAVLNKPARLSDEEFALMKSHAQWTREILRKISFARSLRDIPAVAASHHERLDGRGYPMGATLSELPLLARILAIADVYDALTSIDRPYRKAATPKEGLGILQRERGASLDPQLVDLFAKQRLYSLPKN